MYICSVRVANSICPFHGLDMFASQTRKERSDGLASLPSVYSLSAIDMPAGVGDVGEGLATPEPSPTVSF